MQVNLMGNLKKELILPCMTCPLCDKLFRDATTIIECLHTFCRRCIEKKLSDDEGGECCPICKVGLGPSPKDKLRCDNSMQELRAKVFPYKRIKGKAPAPAPAPEAVTPVSLPAKRKERSLSSLVTPGVSKTNEMTGRTSKSTARKASKGSNYALEKPFRKEDVSTEDDKPESTSSLETLYKYTQSMRKMQGSAAGEPSNNLNTDNGRRNSSENMENRADQWKPIDRLMEAANRSNSLKVSTEGLVEKTGLANTTINKELKLKAKLQHKNNGNENTSRKSENRKPRRTKALPSQVVVHPSRAECGRKNYPVWFSLVSLEGDVTALPQVSSRYIKIKDGNIPVSFIQKYLKSKLGLASEDEVEIKCMGKTVIPTFTVNTVLNMWLQTTIKDRVSATIGSSAKEFVLVLNYARRVICLSD